MPGCGMGLYIASCKSSSVQEATVLADWNSDTYIPLEMRAAGLHASAFDTCLAPSPLYSLQRPNVKNIPSNSVTHDLPQYQLQTQFYTDRQATVQFCSFERCMLCSYSSPVFEQDSRQTIRRQTRNVTFGLATHVAQLF